jgi:Zn-dependent peptidase ImmA (M78 family)
MLLPERYLADAYLETRAVALLRAARTNGCWNGTPPIPVELVGELVCGLRLGWLDLGPGEEGARILGALVAEQQIVYLNEAARDVFDRYPGLERFTWAHEIGHFVLHIDPALLLQERLALLQPTPTILCRAGVKSRRELQADRFAALLLMPSELIGPRAAATNTALWPPLYALRDEFEVSISAMVIRVRALGYRTPTDTN